MTSISANPAPTSPAAAEHLDPRKNVELADAAVMLIPGLEHARSLLTVAIRLLRSFAPPQGEASSAEAAAKLRRMLAEFGHPNVRR
jgi:hypothetical protein